MSNVCTKSEYEKEFTYKDIIQAYNILTYKEALEDLQNRELEKMRDKK